MIRTARLDLLPGTIEVLKAELAGREALAGILGIEIPASWPPPLFDVDAMQWMLGRLEEDPAFEEWGFRYFVRRGEDGAPGITVGAGGFKGPPTPEGSVEVGYSVLSEFQRQGFATEATNGLVQHAYEDSQVTHVIAETLPGLTPSIGVLEKAGFTFVGEGSEPEVIRYEHRREQGSP
jgi:RimJ/RimL family protein N-acetyltransferase